MQCISHRGVVQLAQRLHGRAQPGFLWGLGRHVEPITATCAPPTFISALSGANQRRVGKKEGGCGGETRMWPYQPGAKSTRKAQRCGLRMTVGSPAGDTWKARRWHSTVFYDGQRERKGRAFFVRGQCATYGDRTRRLAK